MLDVSSADIRAIVIGIDVYGYGDSWTLCGPAADALRTVDWLLDAGVEQRHIALFLSPHSWRTDAVQKWMREKAWAMQRDACQQPLCDFFNVDLHKLGGKALLVHWGGHGAVDDDTRQNCLFTADARRDAPYCLSAQNLLHTLSDIRLAHLAQQVFIFDICAGAFSRLGAPVLPNPARLYKSGKTEFKVQQCAMFASSLGLLAANISQRGTGLFSALLFAAIRTCPTLGIGDFVEAFERVLAEARDNGLGAQRPRLQFKKPEDLELDVGNPVPTLALPELLDRIGTRQYPPNLLKRLYLQSLPLLPRDVAGPSVEDWLRDLADTRPRNPGYASPLAEFAERLGRADQDPVCNAWARENTEPGQYSLIVRKLDEEGHGDLPISTLFIQIRNDTASELHWWLEAPDFDQWNGVQTEPLGTAGVLEGLEACLSRIVLEASQRLDASYRLRIGFITPASMFALGLESMRIRWGEDSFTLGEQYPVLFHWYDRTVSRQQRYVVNWNDIMRTLGPRLRQGANVPVHWLEPASRKNAQARYARACEQLRDSAIGAVCLGIDHPYADDAQASLATVLECLRSGIPCLFWLRLPRSSRKAQEVRDRVTTAFASVLPRVAPVAVWRSRRIARDGEKIVPLGVVWDEPAYLPARQSTPSNYRDTR